MLQGNDNGPSARRIILSPPRLKTPIRPPPPSPGANRTPLTKNTAIRKLSQPSTNQPRAIKEDEQTEGQLELNTMHGLPKKCSAATSLTKEPTKSTDTKNDPKERVTMSNGDKKEANEQYGENKTKAIKSDDSYVMQKKSLNSTNDNSEDVNCNISMSDSSVSAEHTKTTKKGDFGEVEGFNKEKEGTMFFEKTNTVENKVSANRKETNPIEVFDAFQDLKDTCSMYNSATPVQHRADNKIESFDGANHCSETDSCSSDELVLPALSNEKKDLAKKHMPTPSKHNQDLNSMLVHSESEPTPVNKTARKNIYNKPEKGRDVPTKIKNLKVEIPTNPLIMSPISDTPIEANNLLSKETFEERLANLQSRMENQLMDQLEKIENKLCVPNAIPPQSGPTPKTKESISEMTSKIMRLQTDIGTKDLEILSLKRDIVALETKLAASVAVPQTPVKSKDAMVGDGDVTGDMWISAETARQLEDEIKTEREKIEQLQMKNTELQAQISTAERQLKAFAEKYERVERQIEESDRSLKKERAAKEEIISLLQQTREGMEVDAELAKSIREEKERNDELISRLENDYKQLEVKTTATITALNIQVEDQQKSLSSEKMQYSDLNEKLNEMMRTNDEEKQKLTKAHTMAIDSLQNSMMRTHAQEKEALHSQINEERLAKMEKEVERNEAMQKMELAMHKTNAAEAKLNEMTGLIKEAKVLVGVNERLHRALHIETDRRKTLHNKLEDLKGRIRVYVRIRPISRTEEGNGCKEIMKKEDKRTCVMLCDTDKGTDAKSWEFDQIFFGADSDGNTQDHVFQDTRLLITSAVDGFNVCIFAYGQTGSGKTYTMFGAGGLGGTTQLDGTLDENSGIAPRAAVELFRILREKESSSYIEVEVSMFELYNDALRDLLASAAATDKKKDQRLRETLKIVLAEHSESGMVEVEGAMKERVENAKELLVLFQRGSDSRTTASTQMNDDSSRSHLITSMVTIVKNKRTGRTVRGKLTLVDLAGSERVSKSGASGHQLKEAQSINKSLSALGDVIGALTSGNKHVPYRNHPLTMLMSDSMGGSAKTLMFLCCSPVDYNRSETTNSLDFAKRCKDVKNNISKDGGSSQSSQVRALRAELARMKKEKGGSVRRRPGIARRPGM
mmetsp:Transcript_143/g.182  ORF Transcript_143/g.182 Transcript_143/m.182 type:complete len:1137 (+) Transcript_143:534-3944(+)